MVRDLCLGRPVEDVDLVVEGDAAAFAQELASRLGGRARLHGRFATAAVALPDSSSVDVAAARRETYRTPGALPDVAAAPIEEDLRRRDFTINAMAIELAPSRRLRLRDPLGGLVDLARRRLVFLHDRSAFDDPTRAFRAVRYACRLGFAMAPSTGRAIAAALDGGAFDAVSADRIRRELARILSEPHRDRAVRLLCRHRLTRALGGGLAGGPAVLRRLRRAESLARDWPEAFGWETYLLVWAAGMEAPALRRLAERLALPGDSGRRMRTWSSTGRRLRALARPLRPSALRRLIAGLATEEIAAMAVLLPAGAARRAVAVARNPTVLAIQGRDLVAAGLPPGPAVGRALAATRAAREDGILEASEELDFALRRARSRGRKP